MRRLPVHVPLGDSPQAAVRVAIVAAFAFLAACGMTLEPQPISDEVWARVMHERIHETIHAGMHKRMEERMHARVCFDRNGPRTPVATRSLHDSLQDLARMPAAAAKYRSCVAEIADHDPDVAIRARATEVLRAIDSGTPIETIDYVSPTESASP